MDNRLADERPACRALGHKLAQLHEGAGKLTYDSLLDKLKKQHPHLRFGRSSLGSYFNGKSTPQTPAKFRALVVTLTGREPTEDEKRMFREATQEGASRQGNRSGRTPATKSEETRTPQGATSEKRWRLPALSMVHFVNSRRLNTLLASRDIRVDLPSIPPPGQRDFWSLGGAEVAIINKLKDVELPVRRLTQDFDLRSLKPGDLLVFDREVRTRNGPSPNQTFPLTGDLTRDPLVYIKTRGVRIVMPYDPEFVTTSTAYSAFSEGKTPMFGLCVIKDRGKPGDPPHVYKRGAVDGVSGERLLKKPKVQFVASPLLLGVCDPWERDPDLTEKVAWEVHDFETGDSEWCGRWNRDTESSQAGA